MTSTQFAFHAWASVGCFTSAALGVLVMLVGIVAPSSRRRVGDRLFRWGVTIALSSVVLYLAYAVTAIITVVVVRT